MKIQDHKWFGRALILIGFSQPLLAGVAILEKLEMFSLNQTALVIVWMYFGMNGMIIGWFGVGVYYQQIDFTEQSYGWLRRMWVVMTYMLAGYALLISFLILIFYLF